MNLKEKVEKEIQSWYDYYQTHVQQVKDAELSMVNLAGILDELQPVESYCISYNTIEVTFQSVLEARAFLSQILEKTSISKFIKISKPRLDRLDWGYYVEYGKASLTVYPAEPNKDCVATKRVNTYTSWVCESKEV